MFIELKRRFLWSIALLLAQVESLPPVRMFSMIEISLAEFGVMRVFCRVVKLRSEIGLKVQQLLTLAFLETSPTGFRVKCLIT
jgi:hypothetical protein